MELLHLNVERLNFYDSVGNVEPFYPNWPIYFTTSFRVTFPIKSLVSLTTATTSLT